MWTEIKLKPKNQLWVGNNQQILSLFTLNSRRAISTFFALVLSMESIFQISGDSKI